MAVVDALRPVVWKMPNVSALVVLPGRRDVFLPRINGDPIIDGLHAWLRAMIAQRSNVYVSDNAIRPVYSRGRRTRLALFVTHSSVDNWRGQQERLKTLRQRPAKAAVTLDADRSGSTRRRG
jgi:hypothetical protein